MEYFAEADASLNDVVLFAFLRFAISKLSQLFCKSSRKNLYFNNKLIAFLYFCSLKTADNEKTII